MQPCLRYALFNLRVVSSNKWPSSNLLLTQPFLYLSVGWSRCNLNCEHGIWGHTCLGLDPTHVASTRCIHLSWWDKSSSLSLLIYKINIESKFLISMRVTGDSANFSEEMESCWLMLLFFWWFQWETHFEINIEDQVVRSQSSRSEFDSCWSGFQRHIGKVGKHVCGPSQKQRVSILFVATLEFKSQPEHIHPHRLL